MASTLLRQVGADSARSWNVRRLGTVLRERAWLIFLCILLGGAVATFYLTRAPRAYVATTTIKYQSALSRLLAIFEKDTADPAAQIAEVRRTLLSRELLRNVVESQRLIEHARFGAGATGDRGREQAVDALLERLVVQVPPNDVVIYVSVRDSSPDLAARVANAVVDGLFTEYSRMRSELQGEVSTRLQNMLQRVRSELQQEERTAVPAGGAAPPAIGRDQELVTSLRTLSDQLAEAEVRRLQLASELSQARTTRDPEAALQVGFIAAQDAVEAARRILLEKQVAFEEVNQRYREKHPRHLEAQEALRQAREGLKTEITKTIASLEQEAATAQKARNDLQAQYEAKLAEISKLASQPATTNLAAVRELEIVRQFYDRVIGRLKEFEFGGEILMAPLQQIQRATPPTQSQGPDPARTLAYGLLAGLAAGLLLSLVFGYGDTSLRSVDEVEQVLNLAVLGVVPRLKDNETEMAAAEGFRSLRTSIAVSSKGKEPRLLLFTSTSPDEGKTFCALNFAVGLAQQGHRSVLVECDLRRPMAAPSLTMVKVDAPGVTDFLKTTPSPSTSAARESGSDRGRLSFAEIRRKQSEGSAESQPVVSSPPGADSISLEDIVQRTEVSNLFFVAAGRPVAHPTELLARPRFEEMLNQLLQQYDRVVLDSAPVLGVSETLLIASRMHGVCFVIRGSQTPRRAVIRAVEILRRAEVPLLGAILNGIVPSRSDPYGQDYYYHRTNDRPAS